MQNRPDSEIPKKFEFKYLPNQTDLRTGSDFP